LEAADQQAQSSTLARIEPVTLLPAAREGSRAIIGYIVYSQVIKCAEFVNIGGELQKHAAQELTRALVIAEWIDVRCGIPAVVAKTL